MSVQSEGVEKTEIIVDSGAEEHVRPWEWGKSFGMKEAGTWMHVQTCQWDSNSTPWGKGCSGKTNVLKAGSVIELQSVRPSHALYIQDVGDEENADELDESEMEGERLSVEDEGEVVKKVKGQLIMTRV